MNHPSRHTIPTWVRRLAVLGVLAWTATAMASPWDFGFEWVNITGDLPEPMMVMEGHHLYLLEYGRGLYYRLAIVDINNPRFPVKLQDYQSGLPLNGQVNGFTVAQSIIYISISNGGVDILDARDPSRINKSGNINIDQVSTWLASQGNCLFVGVMLQGSGFIIDQVSIYDVEDPASPRLLSTLSCESTGFDVKDNLLVTRDGRIFNVADPAHPIESSAENESSVHASYILLNNNNLYGVNN